MLTHILNTKDIFLPNLKVLPHLFLILFLALPGIAQEIKRLDEQGQSAVDDYYNILKGGGSKYSPELIKDAGIDPMSPEPVALTMPKMNRVMDQMEEILETMGK